MQAFPSGNNMNMGIPLDMVTQLLPPPPQDDVSLSASSSLHRASVRNNKSWKQQQQRGIAVEKPRLAQVPEATTGPKQDIPSTTDKNLVVGATTKSPATNTTGKKTRTRRSKSPSKRVTVASNTRRPALPKKSSKQSSASRSSRRQVTPIRRVQAASNPATATITRPQAKPKEAKKDETEESVPVKAAANPSSSPVESPEPFKLVNVKTGEEFLLVSHSTSSGLPMMMATTSGTTATNTSPSKSRRRPSTPRRRRGTSSARSTPSPRRRRQTPSPRRSAQRQPASDSVDKNQNNNNNNMNNKNQNVPFASGVTTTDHPPSIGATSLESLSYMTQTLPDNDAPPALKRPSPYSTPINNNNNRSSMGTPRVVTFCKTTPNHHHNNTGTSSEDEKTEDATLSTASFSDVDDTHRNTTTSRNSTSLVVTNHHHHHNYDNKDTLSWFPDGLLKDAIVTTAEFLGYSGVDSSNASTAPSSVGTPPDPEFFRRP